MYQGGKFVLALAPCLGLRFLAGMEVQAMGAESPGDEWARNNPPCRVEVQATPVPKDNAHPRVSAAEREAIGLPAPTWTKDGKVHPAVTAALEEQKRIIQEQPHMAWVQFDRPAGFEGMAYVDVYVRHERRGDIGSAENQVAIREVQKRLLAQLTAAEFSLIYAFRHTGGFIGYVNGSGLTKLLDHPEVVAIGLDDQPRPEDPPRAIATPRDPKDPDRWTLAKGKIDPQVTTALGKSSDGYTFVGVALAPVPKADGTWQDVLKQSHAAARELEDRVLSSLSAADFQLRSRGGGLTGYVNAAGLQKLDNHPDVVGIGLEGVFEFHGTQGK